MECLQLGQWESPPKSQLVFIGTDWEELQALKEGFEALGRAAQAAAAPHCAGPKEEAAVGPGQGASMQEAEWQRAAACAMRARLRGLHERLEVQGAEQGGTGGEGAGQAESASAAAGPVVGFGVAGDALHGVRGSEVAGSCYRQATARLLGPKGLLLLGMPEPPALSALGQGAAESGGGAERLTSLQCVVPGGWSTGAAAGGAGGLLGPEAAGEAAAEALGEVLLPLLRRAFPHAGCRCDVVSEMHARGGA